VKLLNKLVGLYLYAYEKRKEGVSDKDELYYAALSELEKEGWYDSEKGTLKCLQQDDFAFLVADFMVGFEEDYPDLGEKIKALFESEHPISAPEILFVCVFMALQRMVV